MINRHIMIAGSGRTGTSGMTRLFQKLIGKKNVSFGTNILQSNKIQPYNFFHPKQQYINLVLDKKKEILQDRPHFCGNWEWAMAMYLIEKYIPSVRFFVTLRDPVATIQSLKQRRWNKKIKIETPMEYEDFCLLKSDEQYFDDWIILYRFILKQIQSMQHTPFLVYFDFYIKSVYNQLFLNLYGLDKNPRKTKEFLKTKINSSEKKQALDVRERKIEIAYDIMGEVIMACQDNWVVREL